MPNQPNDEQRCFWCDRDDPIFETMPERLMALYVKLGGEPPSSWER